ncbi:MAG: flippase-like domain-containing protein [Saprospiraceae bacterium]|nr:flippase-like domain-containing protein [Saprospiraceae bacterium]
MSASFMLSNVLELLRWQQMLQPFGVKISLLKATSAIMVAYLTNLVIPRAGEIARANFALSGTVPISFESPWHRGPG